MTELRLYADRSGLHDGTPWVLLDGKAQVQVEGHGIASAPKADGILVVVADDCISVISLPRRLRGSLFSARCNLANVI